MSADAVAVTRLIFGKEFESLTDTITIIIVLIYSNLSGERIRKRSILFWTFIVTTITDFIFEFSFAIAEHVEANKNGENHNEGAVAAFWIFFSITFILFVVGSFFIYTKAVRNTISDSNQSNEQDNSLATILKIYNFVFKIFQLAVSIILFFISQATNNSLLAVEAINVFVCVLDIIAIFIPIEKCLRTNNTAQSNSC